MSVLRKRRRGKPGSWELISRKTGNSWASFDSLGDLISFVRENDDITFVGLVGVGFDSKGLAVSRLDDLHALESNTESRPE